MKRKRTDSLQELETLELENVKLQLGADKLKAETEKLKWNEM